MPLLATCHIVPDQVARALIWLNSLLSKIYKGYYSKWSLATNLPDQLAQRGSVLCLCEVDTVFMSIVLPEPVTLLCPWHSIARVGYA